MELLDLFKENEGEEILADYEYPDEMYFDAVGVTPTEDDQFGDLRTLFDGARNRGVTPEQLLSILDDSGTYLLNPKRMSVVMNIVKMLGFISGDAYNIRLENNKDTRSTAVVLEAPSFCFVSHHMMPLSIAFKMADSGSIEQRLNGGVRIALDVIGTLVKVKDGDDAAV